MVHIQELPVNKSGRRKRSHLPDELIPDSRPLQDQVIESQEELERIEGAINRLNARPNAVIVALCDGRGYSEIAQQLGISSGGTRRNVCEARNLLEAELNKV